MEQYKLDAFQAQLESMTVEDYETGAPFNYARDTASGYDEFRSCVKMIEATGRSKGISEDRLVADSVAYSNIYYPQESQYYVRDGERHYYVLPYNASEGAELSTIVLNGHKFFLNLGEYTIDESGVYCKMTVKGKEYTMKICSHPIVPIGIMVERDGKEQVIIRYINHGNLQERHFYKSEVYRSSSILRLVDYDIDANKELCVYLKTVEDLNRGIVPDFKVFKTAYHIGWLDQNYQVFYPYAASDYYSDLANTLPDLFNAVCDSKGNLAQWKALVNRIRDDDHIHARIALAASFASVLVQPLGAQPFMVHLWGFTGSGKTVTLAASAGVWANPHPSGGYVISFDATGISLVEYAKFCHSLPGCINELQSSKDRDPEHFSTLIYSLCEGTPRTRSKATGGLQQQTGWMNCFITTGEQPIIEPHTQMAGALNRIIQIECPDNMLWEDEQKNREYFNGVSNCYGVAGRAFISYLLADNNLAHAREVYNGFCDTLSKTEATSKQAHEAALILTADTLVSDWIFQDDTKLALDDIVPFLQTKEDIDTAAHIHRLVLDWIIRNTKRFENQEIGKFDTLDGREVCCITQKEFNKLMSELSFSPAVYCKWARAAGKLITDPGRNRKNVRINGIPTGCICILHKE